MKSDGTTTVRLPNSLIEMLHDLLHIPYDVSSRKTFLYVMSALAPNDRQRRDLAREYKLDRQLFASVVDRMSILLPSSDSMTRQDGEHLMRTISGLQADLKNQQTGYQDDVTRWIFEIYLMVQPLAITRLLADPLTKNEVKSVLEGDRLKELRSSMKEYSNDILKARQSQKQQSRNGIDHPASKTEKTGDDNDDE